MDGENLVVHAFSPSVFPVLTLGRKMRHTPDEAHTRCGTQEIQK